MIHESDDQPIQEAFEALKGQRRSSSATPDFGSMMARARAEAAELDRAAPDGDVTPITEARTSTRRRAARAWIPLAAAAAAAALLLVNAPSSADRDFERLVASYTEDVASGALRSPTSSLLHTPGLDLGSVPSFSSSLRGLDGRRRPAGSDSEGMDS